MLPGNPTPVSVDLPKNCVELLQAMVRINSVTPRASGIWDAERELGKWVQQFAQASGLETAWLPVEGCAPNLLITLKADAQAPWVLFDSHLDTVGIEGMTIDPFAGEIRAGRIYGRGTCDTKGTGAAMLMAMLAVRDSGELKNNVALLLTVGEEHHQAGAISFAENDLPRLDWRPSGVVIGEPTELNAVAASNGFIRFRLRTRGKAAHSSTPHLGHNAITDMARVLLAVQSEHIDQPRPTHPLTGGGSCSINLITGGTQMNVVPSVCELGVDERVIPGAQPEEVLTAIEALLLRLHETDPKLDVEIFGVETALGYSTPECDKWSKTCATTLSSSGFTSTVVGAPYTTNANHYAAAGLPCVVLGPGDIALAHTPAESIGIDELEQGVEAYHQLMLQELAEYSRCAQ